MATNLPNDLLEEILIRVRSVKSLVRFSSASKTLRSLIQNPDFITRHANLHAQIASTPTNSSFSFVTSNFSHILKLYSVSGSDSNRRLIDWNPPSLTHDGGIMVIGCCRGLICLIHRENDHHMVYMWNPATRKSEVIFADGELAGALVGLGFDARTSSFMLVTVPKIAWGGVLPLKVYSMTSSGAWKFSSCKSFAMENNWVTCHHPLLFINGVCYLMSDGRLPSAKPKILSYDLVTEAFKDIRLPDSALLSYSVFSNDNNDPQIIELNEKLCLVDNYRDNDTTSICTNYYIIDVWMMDDQVWSKRFSVTIANRCGLNSFMFTRSGMLVCGERDYGERVFIAKPGSDQVIQLSLNYIPHRFFLYEETLHSVGTDSSHLM